MTYVNGSSGLVFLPIPYPQKLIANIGVTPIKGANIPRYRPLKPYVIDMYK